MQYSTLSTANSCVCVPLRQSLIISVTPVEGCSLPAGLFSPDVISRLVYGVTGECPWKILISDGSEILLVFADC